MGPGEVLGLVVDSLYSRLYAVSGRHGDFILGLVEDRYRNEGFLQVEVASIVGRLPVVMEYLPEKPYPGSGEGSRRRCDLWFRDIEGREYWVEMKVIPTNYKSKRPARAITDSINSVLDDLDKLDGLCGEGLVRSVLFMVYPLYPDRIKLFNTKHLRRILDRAGVRYAEEDLSQPSHPCPQASNLLCRSLDVKGGGMINVYLLYY
jgi:hypothetical protein